MKSRNTGAPVVFLSVPHLQELAIKQLSNHTFSGVYSQRAITDIFLFFSCTVAAISTRG